MAGSSEIGYREDGVSWITAGDDVLDAHDAERVVGRDWKVVEEVFLGPTGEMVNSKDEEWSECDADAPDAHRGWRLVDTAAHEIMSEGEVIANPHYTPETSRRAEREGSREISSLSDDTSLRRSRVRTSSPSDCSPVIRALRRTSDEVQLGRVLAALCKDPEVARSFCTAVLNRATGGRRRVELPPSGVACTEERVLASRVTHDRLRRQRKDLGRVDLDFGGANGWRLIVELKLNSGFQPRQIGRYGFEAPVVAVMRDAEKAPPDGSENWVGAVSWGDLTDDLRALPLEEQVREHWVALLDVLEADGDLDRVPPKLTPEVQEAGAFMERIAGRLVDHFRGELHRRYGAKADPVVEALRASRVRQRPPWVQLSIGPVDNDWWLEVAMRDAWSPTPRLKVTYWLPNRRSVRKLRGQLSDLETLHGFKKQNDSYVFDAPIRGLGGAVHDDAALEIVGSKLGELVEAGVFDLDVQ